MADDFLEGFDFILGQVLQLRREDLIDALDVLDEDILVAYGCRNDVVGCHIRCNSGLNLDFLQEGLVLDFVAGVEFHFIQNLEFLEQGHALRTEILLECLSDIVGAAQSPLGSLGNPLLAVTVAFETDILGRDDELSDDLENGLVFLHSLLHKFRNAFVELGKFLSHSCIEHYHRH